MKLRTAAAGQVLAATFYDRTPDSKEPPVRDIQQLTSVFDKGYEQHLCEFLCQHQRLK
jgi:hypothetical protein